MLQKETNVTFYRNKQKGLLAFFEPDNDFVYYCDVPGLLVAMGFASMIPMNGDFL